MKLSILILIVMAYADVAGQCNSTGPLSASSFSNNASVGTIAWTNVSNAQSSDNNYVSTTINLGILSSATSNYLTATGFNFSLPSDAGMCGIKVEIEKQYNIIIGVFSSVTDNSVRLIKGGVISGTNLALGGNWPSNDAYSSYGSNSEAWGLTWTAADINSSNFGVAISQTVATGLASLTLNGMIDHIDITVYYTVPLPINLKSFVGSIAGPGVKLQWVTASESNSSHFIVEKMTGSGSWQKIDSVPAAVNSSTDRNYISYDLQPDIKNTYRIKEVDLDGKATFSKMISISYDKNANSVKLYPNPVRDILNISSTQNIHSLKLLDQLGKQVLTSTPPKIANEVSLAVAGIPPGIYYLEIQTMRNRLFEKVIIE